MTATHGATDVIGLLQDGAGCPVCRRRADAERSWISAFTHETNADSEVMAAVIAARGFCAAHTRALVGRNDAAVLLPTPLSGVAHARAADARSARDDTARPCLICTSEDQSAADATAVIARRLGEPAVLDAAGADGALCAQHLVDAAAAASGDPARRLVAALADRLTRSAALTDLAGHDHDAVRRAAYLHRQAEALPARDEAARYQPTLQRLLEDLSRPRCAGCHGAGEGAVRYLQWLAGAIDDTDHRLDQRETSLCRRHLHDLAALAPDPAAEVVGRERDALRARVGQLTGQLGGSGRQQRSALAAYAEAVRSCPACLAAETGAQQAIAVTSAALGDRRVREAMGAGHGLCVRHAPVVSARSGDSLPREVLHSRVLTLAFELDEARRKRNWWVRHEPQGKEMTAWRHAPTWLAGATYLGLEIPAGSGVGGVPGDPTAAPESPE
jgi:hypothetical protein